MGKINNICIKKIPLEKFINTNKVLDIMEKTLRKYDMSVCEYSGNLLGRYREKEIVPTQYWGEPKEEKFEDGYVKTPHEGDKILELIYGDYMKLPPVASQVVHRVKLIKCR